MAATLVDVRRFGAVLDGRTDDAPAIQRAIDSLPSSGGVVAIPGMAAIGPSGVRLSGRSNVTIWGSWSTSGFRSLAPTALASGLANSAMFQVTGCSNCTIRNMRFDGNGQNISAVACLSSNAITFRANEFYNTAGYAALAGQSNHGNQYLNNTIHDTLGYGVGLWLGLWNGGMEYNALIQGNVIRDTSGDGIGGDWVGSQLSGNLIDNAGATGIAISAYAGHASTNDLITGNTIRNVAWHGIQSDSGDGTPTAYIAISNNDIESSGLSGVYALFVDHWQVVNNTVLNSGTRATDGWITGIEVSTASNTTISGNEVGATVAGLGGIGIWLSGTSNVTVSNNYVHGNSRSGIVVRSPVNLTIQGNQITNNSRCGLFFILGDLFSCTVIGNTISGNLLGSFSDSSTGVPY